MLVPEDMVIQVEHVAFTSLAENPTDTPIVSSSQLEKIIVSNAVPKQLEFT